MHEQVEVVYENGVLRPLGPLPGGLREHQHLTITLGTLGTLDIPTNRLDAAFVAASLRDAAPAVSLEEVRRILAKVPGSLAEAVIAEREDR